MIPFGVLRDNYVSVLTDRGDSSKNSGQFDLLNYDPCTLLIARAFLKRGASSAVMSHLK